MIRFMFYTTFLAATTLAITPVWANTDPSNVKSNLAVKESGKDKTHKTKEPKNNEADKNKTAASKESTATAAKEPAKEEASFANAAKNAKAELAAKNLAATQTFLEENKKKPGIVTTASGLQYQVVKEGKGKVPGPSSFVTVNYKGTLADGTLFDSSTQGPVTFAVNAVIPGWTEALQLMKEGSKWIVYVPPQLAYGEKGIGRIIGPNQLLVFEIELVDTDENLSEEYKEKKAEQWEDAD